ncbi:hypothetical protein [Thiohalorhabdus methylotrophus]|uniref:Uncharacterized protein n=1 Tax=Thiohalorhabdus methylotrophus TaxID=3242694 RepID=A0ABV4TYC3_9GAMM
MRISGGELGRARAVTEDLLEELGIAVYLYQVEPRDGIWEVRVECALHADGWQRSLIQVERERLLAVPHDSGIRRELLAEWGAELVDCRREAEG